MYDSFFRTINVTAFFQVVGEISVEAVQGCRCITHCPRWLQVEMQSRAALQCVYSNTFRRFHLYLSIKFIYFDPPPKKKAITPNHHICISNKMDYFFSSCIDVVVFFGLLVSRWRIGVQHPWWPVLWNHHRNPSGPCLSESDKIINPERPRTPRKHTRVTDTGFDFILKVQFVISRALCCFRGELQ